MKASSLLFGLLVGLLLMVVFPILMIFTNECLSFPIVNMGFLKILGTVLVCVGVFIFLFNSFAFKRFGKGTPVPVEPPKKLVVCGLYKYTRNSMYLGYFGIVFGEFLVLGHLLLLLYFLGFVLITHLYVVFVEEPELKKRFGESYGQYLKSVPRWIPKLKYRNLRVNFFLF